MSAGQPRTLEVISLGNGEEGSRWWQSGIGVVRLRTSPNMMLSSDFQGASEFELKVALPKCLPPNLAQDLILVLPLCKESVDLNSLSASVRNLFHPEATYVRKRSQMEVRHVSRTFHLNLWTSMCVLSKVRLIFHFLLLPTSLF